MNLRSFLGFAPAPRSVAQRLRRWTIFTLAALMFAVCAFLMWLGQESSLQVVAKYVAKASGTQIEGVTGSLYGPLHIKQWRYQDREMALQADDVQFDYSPSKLLRAQLDITRLQAASFSYHGLAPSATPVTLPNSLVLPVTVNLPQVLVQKLHVQEWARSVDLQDVQFGLHINQQRWRLSNGQMHSQWGLLTLDASLGSNAPFVLNGKLGVNYVDAKIGTHHGNLSLQGNLSRLQLNGLLKAPQSRLHVTSTLHPFDAIPLSQLYVQGKGINPALFNAHWPSAELQIEAKFALASQAPRAITGMLQLRNHLPGTLDQQKLPFAQLNAELKGNWPQASKQESAPWPELQVKQVLLDLAQGGKFTGQASLHDKRLALELTTQGVNLQGVHSKLRPTKITGKIGVQQKMHGQSLQADLLYSDMALRVNASLQEKVLRLHNASLQARGSKLSLQGELALQQTRSFSGTGDVTRFNPADWGNFASADLNIGFTLQGKLAPEVLNSQLSLDAQLRPSRFREQNLLGNAHLDAVDGKVKDVQAKLQWGANHLQARGSLGKASDRLAWEVNAPQLDALQAGMRGQLQASGVAHGDLKNLASSFDLNVRDLHLAQGSASGLDSVLSAQGEVQLHAPWRLKVQASSRHLNPAALGALPSASLTGELAIEGQIGTDWRLGPWQTRLQLQNSTWQDSPLNASVRATLDTDKQQTRLSELAMTMQVGGNQVSAQGKLGLVGDTLQWRIAAPDLAQLDRSLGGKVMADGEFQADLTSLLAGKWDSLAMRLQATGNNLQVPGAQGIKTLQTKLNLPSGADSPLAIDAAVTDMRLGALQVAKGKLLLSGSRRAHELHVQANNEQFDAQVAVSGGLSVNPTSLQWQGQVHKLSNKGAFAAQQSGKAGLQFSLAPTAKFALQNLRLENFALRLGDDGKAGGELHIAHLSKSAAQWQSKGKVRHLPLKFLLPQAAEDLRSDLLLAGEWDMDYTTSLNGRLQLARESGDIRTAQAASSAIQTRQLLAVLTAKQDALAFTFDFDSAHVGHAHLDVSSRLTPGKLDLADNAPLLMHADADLTNLAFLAPLTGVPDVEFAGQLKLQLLGEGTLAAPQLSGKLTAEQLAARWPSWGLKLKNGTARAVLAKNQMQLQEFTIEGQQGKAKTTGYIQFSEQAMKMHLDSQLQQLQVLGRPDRQLVLSGTTQVHLEKKLLSLKGELHANSADIELTVENGPTFSDDVVIVGAAPVKNSNQAMALDLSVDLGENFKLRGGGLKADLMGALRLQAFDRRGPRATGGIIVTKGSYRAYGQNLTITTGKLNFSGALDNPGINITAVRKVQNPEIEVEAGIELRGTLLSPQARLISTPSVPDSEKLMWLVLGHGTEGGSDKDNPLLGLAVSALFGGVESNQFASTFALDEINLSRASGLEATVLTVGKRLSSKAFLTLEQGANSANSLLKLRYTFNPRLSVQVQTGTNNAVDAFYTWRFD